MRMKISDVIRKVNDSEMAKIIGAIVAQHTYGITASEAIKLDYSNTLQALQKEIEVDFLSGSQHRDGPGDTIRKKDGDKASC